MQEQTLQLEQQSKLKVSAAPCAARARGPVGIPSRGARWASPPAAPGGHPLPRTGLRLGAGTERQGRRSGCPEREAWLSAAGIRRSTRPPWSS